MRCIGMLCIEARNVRGTLPERAESQGFGAFAEVAGAVFMVWWPVMFRVLRNLADASLEIRGINPAGWGGVIARVGIFSRLVAPPMNDLAKQVAIDLVHDDVLGLDKFSEGVADHPGIDLIDEGRTGCFQVPRIGDESALIVGGITVESMPEELGFDAQAGQLLIQRCFGW